jgi:hypothetical protein
MAQTSAMDSFFLSRSIRYIVYWHLLPNFLCFVRLFGDNQKITFKQSVKSVTESAAELPSAFHYISQKAVRVIQ